VRRLLGLCAVEVAVFGVLALAFAQSDLQRATVVVQAQNYPSSYRTPPGWSLPAETAIAEGLPSRALGIVPFHPYVTGSAPQVLYSRSDLPNRVFQAGAFLSKNYVAYPNVGTGQPGSLGDGGPAISAELNLSTDSLFKRSGIAVAADGALYIADTKNSTIRAVAGATSSEPGIIRSVAGKWAPAQNVALVEPMGIAADRAGNLYIADHTVGTVSVLTKATGRLTILAHVASPASLAVTADGTKVFVASPETEGVFSVTTLNGLIEPVPGFAPLATGPESANVIPCGGLGAIATTSSRGRWAVCPAGVAVDGRGNLFVADADSGRILRVDAASGKTTEASSGMNTPGDIAFDAQGDLFVSEQGRNRIIELRQMGDPASNLTLTAPAPPAGCPQGASFTYCNEPTAGTSPPFAFTLMNTSGTAVTGLAITPAFEPVGMQPPPAPTNFTTTSTSCSATLAANSSCAINVAFTPLATGPITGQLIVSDSTPSDTQTINLAGTGDDFSLAIVNGQTPEVTTPQGDTATFLAQLNSVGVFGEDGETVTLVCPTNLPQFTTCEFKPCPVIPTMGGATPFSILIHTSTATSETPPIQNPCNSPAAGVRRHAGGPSGILFLTARPPSGGAWRLPALLSILAVIALMGVGAIRGAARAGARRAFAALALTVISGALLAACHKGSNANSTATPVGITNLTVTANAVDSSGNSLRASRGLQVTLDVIKQVQMLP
jgi:sugar lactone lactonase YvrE